METKEAKSISIKPEMIKRPEMKPEDPSTDEFQLQGDPENQEQLKENIQRYYHDLCEYYQIEEPVVKIATSNEHSCHSFYQKMPDSKTVWFFLPFIKEIENEEYESVHYTIDRVFVQHYFCGLEHGRIFENALREFLNLPSIEEAIDPKPKEVRLPYPNLQYNEETEVYDVGIAPIHDEIQRYYDQLCKYYPLGKINVDFTIGVENEVGDYASYSRETRTIIFHQSFLDAWVDHDFEMLKDVVYTMFMYPLSETMNSSGFSELVKRFKSEGNDQDPDQNKWDSIRIVDTELSHTEIKDHLEKHGAASPKMFFDENIGMVGEYLSILAEEMDCDLTMDPKEIVPNIIDLDLIGEIKTITMNDGKLGFHIN